MLKLRIYWFTERPYMTFRKKRGVILIVLPFIAFPTIIFLQLSTRLLIGAEPSLIKTIVNVLSIIFLFVGTIGFIPLVVAGVRLLLPSVPNTESVNIQKEKSYQTSKFGADNYIVSTSESVTKHDSE